MFIKYFLALKTCIKISIFKTVEPYLPEAPRLQGPPRVPFIRGPPDLRQPPPGMILNRPPHPDQYYPPRREIIMNRPLLSDDAGLSVGTFRCILVDRFLCRLCDKHVIMF